MNNIMIQRNFHLLISRPLMIRITDSMSSLHKKSRSKLFKICLKIKKIKNYVVKLYLLT